MGLDSEVFDLGSKYGVNSFEELSEKLLKEKQRPYTKIEIEEGAKRLKAEEIVQSMVDQKFTPYELRKAGANNSLGFFNQEDLIKLKTLKFLNF